jgi:hypothetical protein
VAYTEVLFGIAAALKFSGSSDDPSSGQMVQEITRYGVEYFVNRHCGLSAEDCRSVAAWYDKI